MKSPSNTTTIIIRILIVQTILITQVYGQTNTFLREYANSTLPSEICGAIGIALDQSGNSLVSCSSGYINIYNSSGQFISRFSSPGSMDGQLSGFPQEIAIDLSGNIYVADTYNNRVQKFNSSGVFLSMLGTVGNGDGQFGAPRGIAVDASGNIFVSDGNGCRIQKFSSTGTFVAKWGDFGSGDGQFNNPCGLTIDGSGNVYVADFGNHRIQKFSSTGTFITKWGTEGSSDGQFNKPVGIAVDLDGNIYVAEEGNNRVQKFNSTGTFLSKWGTFGSGPGQFDNAWNIELDNAGLVYVCDGNNSRVQVFTSSQIATSVASASSSEIASIFPNPSNTKTYIFIEDPTLFVKLNVYSMNGMLLYENAKMPANTNYLLPELNPGIYYVKITGTKGTLTKKLVKY